MACKRAWASARREAGLPPRRDGQAGRRVRNVGKEPVKFDTSKSSSWRPRPPNGWSRVSQSFPPGRCISGLFTYL